MSETSYRLGIVTVVYHSDALTIRMVNNELSKLRGGGNIIVVVNNGATLESSSAIAKAIDGTLVTDTRNVDTGKAHRYVIHNEDNSGFAKGNNIGVDFLTRHFDVDYLLFTNNDIEIIDHDVTEQLIAKMQGDARIGVIGPKVVGLDGKCQSPEKMPTFWGDILWMTWGRFLHVKNKNDFDRNTAPEGFYYRVMGSFFLTTCEDYLACGKMDENTFLYAEEMILAERMKTIGKQTYYLPTVSVLHAHGKTIGKYVNLVRGSKIMYQSVVYYYRTYRTVGALAIFLSKILFYPYIYLQYCYRKIKG